MKSLYLLRIQRYLRFFIFCKNSRLPPKVVKIENFHISTEDSSTTLWVHYSLEIALSLTVFEIFAIFVFCKKNVKETSMGAILYFFQTSKIIPKEAFTMMNISYKFGKCTLHILLYTGVAKVPKNLDKNARGGGHLVFLNVPKNIHRSFSDDEAILQI